MLWYGPLWPCQPAATSQMYVKQDKTFNLNNYFYPIFIQFYSNFNPTFSIWRLPSRRCAYRRRDQFAQRSASLFGTGTIQDGTSNQVGRRGGRRSSVHHISGNIGQVRLRFLRTRQRHHFGCRRAWHLSLCENGRTLSRMSTYGRCVHNGSGRKNVATHSTTSSTRFDGWQRCIQYCRSSGCCF